MIITLTGASGTGKTTIADRLIKHLPDARPLMSVTTRTARPSDLPGDYTHVRPEAFDAMASSGEFLWTAALGTTRYGTAADDLRTAFERTATTWMMILVPEVLPLLHGFAAQEGRSDHVRSFFILNPPDETLRRRLAHRGDPPEYIEERMAACADFQARARASDVPYLFIPDEDDLSAKINAVLRALSA